MRRLLLVCLYRETMVQERCEEIHRADLWPERHGSTTLRVTSALGLPLLLYLKSVPPPP